MPPLHWPLKTPRRKPGRVFRRGFSFAPWQRLHLPRQLVRSFAVRASAQDCPERGWLRSLVVQRAGWRSWRWARARCPAWSLSAPGRCWARSASRQRGRVATAIFAWLAAGVESTKH